MRCLAKPPPNAPPGWRPQTFGHVGRTHNTLSTTLRQLACCPAVTTGQQAVLTKAANYWKRNAAYMHYSQYLANGWPIASGVIEGACRHLIQGVSRNSLACAGPKPVLKTCSACGRSSKMAAWPPINSFTKRSAISVCRNGHSKPCPKAKSWLMQTCWSSPCRFNAPSSCQSSCHHAPRSSKNAPHRAGLTNFECTHFNFGAQRRVGA